LSRTGSLRLHCMRPQQEAVASHRGLDCAGRDGKRFRLLRPFDRDGRDTRARRRRAPVPVLVRVAVRSFWVRGPRGQSSVGQLVLACCVAYSTFLFYCTSAEQQQQVAPRELYTSPDLRSTRLCFTQDQCTPQQLTDSSCRTSGHQAVSVRPALVDASDRDSQKQQDTQHVWPPIADQTVALLRGRGIEFEGYFPGWQIHSLVGVAASSRPPLRRLGRRHLPHCSDGAVAGRLLHCTCPVISADDEMTTPSLCVRTDCRRNVRVRARSIAVVAIKRPLSSARRALGRRARSIIARAVGRQNEQEFRAAVVSVKNSYLCRTHDGVQHRSRTIVIGTSTAARSRWSVPSCSVHTIRSKNLLLAAAS
jgi:hypothetical protein